jgi:DNA-3-methyladenine glycosylase II
MTPLYWEQAKRELAEADPVMRRLIRRHDGPALRRRSDAFTAFARSIVGQQISVKAAESVWQRLAAACGAVSPQALLRLDEEALRACGLSARKVDYLRDLARRFGDGSISLEAWERLEDEALIGELTRLRGIGRWTAEMFLIFYMLRPNVLPLDDIGLQRAMSLHYNDERPLSKLKMRAIAKRWIPWRSVATWYLWRSLDPIPVEY